MWPVIKLSNGCQLEVQQRIVVRSLIGNDSPKVRVNDKVEIRHWPPGQLVLVKPLTGNTRFKEFKSLPQEGIDFELIVGEEAFPK